MFNIQSKKIIIIFLALFAFQMVFLNIVIWQVGVVNAQDIREYKPYIQISDESLGTISEPYLCATKDNPNQQCVTIPWAVKYIGQAFRYSVVIGSILAIIMVMIGGMMYLIAGASPARIGQAKQIISGAIIGLVLMLGSYTILNLINPSLVELKPVEIPVVAEVLSGAGSCEELLKQPDKYEVNPTSGKCGAQATVTSKTKEKVLTSTCIFTKGKCDGGEVCVFDNGKYQCTGGLIAGNQDFGGRCVEANLTDLWIYGSANNKISNFDIDNNLDHYTYPYPGSNSDINEILRSGVVIPRFEIHDYSADRALQAYDLADPKTILENIGSTVTECAGSFFGEIVGQDDEYFVGQFLPVPTNGDSGPLRSKKDPTQAMIVAFCDDVCIRFEIYKDKPKLEAAAALRLGAKGEKMVAPGCNLLSAEEVLAQTQELNYSWMDFPTVQANVFDYDFTSCSDMKKYVENKYPTVFETVENANVAQDRLTCTKGNEINYPSYSTGTKGIDGMTLYCAWLGISNYEWSAGEEGDACTWYLAQNNKEGGCKSGLECIYRFVNDKGDMTGRCQDPKTYNINGKYCLVESGKEDDKWLVINDEKGDDHKAYYCEPVTSSYGRWSNGADSAPCDTSTICNWNYDGLKWSRENFNNDSSNHSDWYCGDDFQCHKTIKQSECTERQGEWKTYNTLGGEVSYCVLTASTEAECNQKKGTWKTITLIGGSKFSSCIFD